MERRLVTAGLIWILALCAVPCAGATVERRDGAHDFDFAFGTWKSHVRTNQFGGGWKTIDGIVTTRKVWNGKANLEELEFSVPGGRFEGMTLRLYDPDAKQWNLYFVDSKDGQIGVPVTGAFDGRRGTFYSQDFVDGVATFVRNVYFDVTPNSYRFEQAYSTDAGKTWKANFNASLTRVDPESAPVPHSAGSEPAQQHGFDWQLGSWELHMRRLLHPLTPQATWADLDGTVDVAKIWNGRANLAEVVASGPASRIEILALRTYLPRTQQWTLSFAGSGSGQLGAPMYGSFHHGRGEFYDQETYNGRAIWDRFEFFDVSPQSALDKEAFSEDGGKSWVQIFYNVHTRRTGR
jgi:hypothetical protein